MCIIGGEVGPSTIGRVHKAIRSNTGASGGIKGENIGSTGYGNDAVDGAEIGWESSVVSFWADNKLCKSLDSVGGLFHEERLDRGANGA